MSLKFSEILTIMILLIIYLFLLIGIKKFHGIELIKNTTKREKIITMAAFVIMIFAVSVFASGILRPTDCESGFINEKLSDVFYKIYGSNISFIYFVRFIILELVSLLVCMMSVKNIAIKLNVPHVSYGYLIFTAALSTGTYCILKNNWTSNIILLLCALFVLCLTDCLVYSITKKKMAYMLLNIIIIAVICIIDSNIQVKIFAYAAAIFVSQLILTLLLKVMYRLRNIWQKIVIILYFVSVYFVNWKL